MKQCARKGNSFVLFEEKTSLPQYQHFCNTTLPAYTFPENLEDLAVLRVVVRDGFSHDMANMLLNDMRRHLKFFASQPGYKPTRTAGGYSHGIAPRKKR